MRYQEGGGILEVCTLGMSEDVCVELRCYSVLGWSEELSMLGIMGATYTRVEVLLRMLNPTPTIQYCLSKFDLRHQRGNCFHPVKDDDVRDSTP